MSAVHGIMFRADNWLDAYNFANDVGHTENGLYALKANYGYAGVTWQDLKGFRSGASKLTGHGEGHLFPEGVMVSNGPLGSLLPIAQGLALADRLADNSRTTICTISDGAMMEGEARELCAAIPGLAKRGQLNPFVMVISDNNTKLSGRIDQQSFAMGGSFEALKALGWEVVVSLPGMIYKPSGQPLKAPSPTPKAIVRSRSRYGSKRSGKGKGVVATEQSSSGGHGYPLKTAHKSAHFVEEINGGPLSEAVFVDWIAELEQAHADAEAAKAAAPSVDKPKASKVQAGFPKAMVSRAEDGAAGGLGECGLAGLNWCGAIP